MNIFQALSAALLTLSLIACSPSGAPADAPSESAKPPALQSAATRTPENSPAEKVTAVDPTGGPECANLAATAFSCRVAGGKQLSVCLAGNPAAAEYRFGKPGSPAEMVLTAGPNGGKPVAASTPYSGGGEAQVQFQNGQTGYIVFSRIVRTRFDGEGNDPEFSAGVMIRRAGKMLAEIKCTKPADADLDAGKLQNATVSNDKAFFIPD